MVEGLDDAGDLAHLVEVVRRELAAEVAPDGGLHGHHAVVVPRQERVEPEAGAEEGGDDLPAPARLAVPVQQAAGVARPGGVDHARHVGHVLVEGGQGLGREVGELVLGGGVPQAQPAHQLRQHRVHRGGVDARDLVEAQRHVGDRRAVMGGRDRGHRHDAVAAQGAGHQAGVQATLAVADEVEATAQALGHQGVDVVHPLVRPSGDARHAVDGRVGRGIAPLRQCLGDVVEVGQDVEVGVGAAGAVHQQDRVARVLQVTPLEAAQVEPVGVGGGLGVGGLQPDEVLARRAQGHPHRVQRLHDPLLEHRPAQQVHHLDGGGLWVVPVHQGEHQGLAPGAGEGVDGGDAAVAYRLHLARLGQEGPLAPGQGAGRRGDAAEGGVLGRGRGLRVHRVDQGLPVEDHDAAGAGREPPDRGKGGEHVADTTAGPDTLERFERRSTGPRAPG